MTEFEKFFNANKDFILKYLIKLTKNFSLAEELTQETFFRAYMNFSSIKNKEKASVWLCQIAKNTYYSWYNAQKKTTPLEDAQNFESDKNTEEIFFEKELSKNIINSLRDLDEPYKEVFILSVFDGLSLKDISEIFGKSESWARVTFYRAKQKISERLR